MSNEKNFFCHFNVVSISFAACMQSIKKKAVKRINGRHNYTDSLAHPRTYERGSERVHPSPLVDEGLGLTYTEFQSNFNTLSDELGNKSHLGDLRKDHPDHIAGTVSINSLTAYSVILVDNTDEISTLILVYTLSQNEDEALQYLIDAAITLRAIDPSIDNNVQAEMFEKLGLNGSLSGQVTRNGRIYTLRTTTENAILLSMTRDR